MSPGTTAPPSLLLLLYSLQQMTSQRNFSASACFFPPLRTTATKSYSFPASDGIQLHQALTERTKLVDGTTCRGSGLAELLAAGEHHLTEEADRLPRDISHLMIHACLLWRKRSQLQETPHVPNGQVLPSTGGDTIYETFCNLKTDPLPSQLLNPLRYLLGLLTLMAQSDYHSSN